MTEKLVSVIVPVYNCEKYLETAVSCALNQAYKNIEVLLVNNGSTDASLSICEKMASIDSRVQVIDASGNVGAGEARNIGIDASKGEYIYFLDADDECEPNTISRLVEEMESNGFDVVICGHIAFAEGTSFIEHHSFNRERFYSAQDVRYYASSWLPHGQIGFLWNKLYKASIIKRNGIRFRKLSRLEDGFFNIEYFDKCNSCLVISDELYSYRLSTPEQVLAKHTKEYFDLYALLIHECTSARYVWGTADAPAGYMYTLSLEEIGTCIENNYLSNWGNKEFLDYIRKSYLFNEVLAEIGSIGIYRRVLIRLLQFRCYALLGLVIRFKTFVKTKFRRAYYAIKK